MTLKTGYSENVAEQKQPNPDIQKTRTSKEALCNSARPKRPRTLSKPFPFFLDGLQKDSWGWAVQNPQKAS